MMNTGSQSPQGRIDLTGTKMSADYRKDTPEFKEKKEAAPNFEFGKTFKGVEDDKKEIKKLEKNYLDPNTSDIDKRAASQKLQKYWDEEPALDAEQMRVFLKDVLEKMPSELSRFIEKHCIFELDKGKEGITVDTWGSPGKFELKIGSRSFYDYGQTKYEIYGVQKQARFFNPAKISFLIGKALGYILVEPKDWAKHQPNWGGEKTEYGYVQTGSWLDFVGLCLTDPQKAERHFPDGYNHVRKLIYGLSSGTTAVRKKTEERTYKIAEPKPVAEIDFEEKIEPEKTWFGKKILEFMKNRKLVPEDTIAIDWPTLKDKLWKRTDWYERAFAEIVDKEVGRIFLRQENIGGRDLSLKPLVGDGHISVRWGERYRICTILMADMKFSDWSAERMHILLQATDDLYRQTHGEQITEDSYNFIMRLQRVSNGQAHRLASKAVEYKLVEVGEEYQEYNKEKRITVRKKADRRVFTRKDREEWQEEDLEEVKHKTNREVAAVAQELFEYMKIGERFIEIDEYWDDEDEQKFGKDNKYSYAVGKWDKMLGKPFADEMLGNISYRERIPKLNPDQIAIIARIIAVEAKGANKDICRQAFGGEERPMTGTEHVKGSLLNAYNHYRDIFLKNDKFRGYVNYFLNWDNLQIDAKGNLSLYYGKGNTDKERIKRFVDVEALKNPEYKEAYEICNTYQDEAQSAFPYQKDEGGKIIETDNNLRQKFILDRKEEDVADNIVTLKKAKKKYQVYIIEKIKNSSLTIEVKDLLEKDFLFLDENLKSEFIIDDILRHLQLEVTDESMANYENRIKTKECLKSLMIEIRPYRRELKRIQETLEKLGVEKYDDLLEDNLGKFEELRQIKKALQGLEKEKEGSENEIQELEEKEPDEELSSKDNKKLKKLKKELNKTKKKIDDKTKEKKEIQDQGINDLSETEEKALQVDLKKQIETEPDKSHKYYSHAVSIKYLKEKNNKIKELVKDILEKKIDKKAADDPEVKRIIAEMEKLKIIPKIKLYIGDLDEYFPYQTPAPEGKTRPAKLYEVLVIAKIILASKIKEETEEFDTIIIGMKPKKEEKKGEKLYEDED